MLFKTKLSSLNIRMKIYGFYVFSLCCFLIFNGVRVEAFRNHTRLLNVSQPYRTAYHFQPSKNWMNGTVFFGGFPVFVLFASLCYI
ncbi:putative fructan beta-(2,1)-fructosidase [Helianthus annuus]|uniref:Fructan beta-(2,1)-fructosidase n=1 Tax=Helianthus annuus TaxID=4232 RepID=A0A9K3NWP8_HELAN|nr:putative fructan beta-(2,1)-fructosidase [Helianthus annuus]KAJ0593806.1 putative fructan beta-(2,1)-fructosidase [Helianthus annuus]KAJ0608831.1 putative fructan beta-(2,1)-fructosidase [Helianthus annuus]KAJ0774615.1 putative fructan beta-(2,1)-fructosidase [Helianthus annuus]